MGEQEAQSLFTHLLSAVKFMHKNGIIHRNIRPEMILFAGEHSHYDIKFVDLISAKVIDD